MKHAPVLATATASGPERMQAHPHYRQVLTRLGATVTLLPDGSHAVHRRFGPVRLTWLPAPLTLPDLAGLGTTLLISARDADMDAQLRRSGAIPLMTPQTRAMLDLSGSEQARRAAMQQKWRNRLIHAQRSNLTISHAPFPRDPGHWLLPREAAQQRERRYHTHPVAFTLAWPESQLFEARDGGVPIAAMLILLHPPAASYHIGWSGARGRATSAHNLLLWHAGCWLHRQGITQLDLGTLDTRNAPGLAHFKLGSGARALQSGHSWLYSRYAAPLGRLIA